MHSDLRLIQNYGSKVDDEGELTEEDLPEEVLAHVEDNCPIDQKHFAVSVLSVLSFVEFLAQTIRLSTLSRC